MAEKTPDFFVSYVISSKSRSRNPACGATLRVAPAPLFSNQNRVSFVWRNWVESKRDILFGKIGGGLLN